MIQGPFLEAPKSLNPKKGHCPRRTHILEGSGFGVSTGSAACRGSGTNASDHHPRACDGPLHTGLKGLHAGNARHMVAGFRV